LPKDNSNNNSDYIDYDELITKDHANHLKEPPRKKKRDIFEGYSSEDEDFNNFTSPD
jgi:hypothetical protein